MPVLGSLRRRAGGPKVGCLLASRAPPPNLCDRLGPLRRSPQDPEEGGFHLRHKGFRLHPGEMLRAGGKDAFPPRVPRDLQAAKMAPGLVGVRTQALAPGCRGVAWAASILQPPSLSTSPQSLWLGGEPWRGELRFSIIFIPY